MIPKIIHYIWIGSEIPKNIEAQIKKNYKFFKGYEVKIWTKENMPKLNEFAKRAYEEKQWAFVSDYLRFVILREHGGIYLDTDMDVLKPLDDLLNQPFFSGWDRTGKYVYAGIVGVEANHIYISAIVEKYNEIVIGLYPTSPEIMTKCYNEYEEKEFLSILDSKYFYPLLDGERVTQKALEFAYTNHLWHESWRKYVWLRRLLRRIGLMKIYHRLRGVL